MNDNSRDKRLPTRSSSADIDAFLDRVRQLPAPRDGSGRLIFGMDATASREATWDQACHIQGEMFRDTRDLGGLAIQLCYYRGFDEFRASAWYERSPDLLRAMSAVRCLAGQTQIARMLHHCIETAKREPVHAVVFVGDAMEEHPNRLSEPAGQLGLLGVPVFIFQEGHDHATERAYRRIAQLSRGAWCRFDSSSPEQLRRLLGAVAVYATGGLRALERLTESGGDEIRLLTRQLRGED